MLGDRSVAQAAERFGEAGGDQAALWVLRAHMWVMIRLLVLEDCHWIDFRRAGKAAQEIFANEVALHYYQRLLPLLAPQEQGEILLTLCGIQQHIGQWALFELFGTIETRFRLRQYGTCLFFP